MATIQKRKDSYLIRVSCGYDTVGKQIIKSMTWKPPPDISPKQAEKELNRVAVEFETKVLNGDVANIKNIKLSDFCTQYLEISENMLAPSTKMLYKKVIETIIIPSLGHMKLKDIKPIHVQKFIQMLSGEGVRTDGKGEKLCPATIRRYFTVLKSIMARAYRLDLIEKNPTNTAKLDIPSIEEPKIEIFSHEEVIQMLSCLEKEPLMFQVFIQLAIVTGCRRGELVAIRWENIDFDTNTINILLSNYKIKGEEIKSKTPKTKSSIREIVIPEYITDLLRSYREQQEQEKINLGDRWIEGGWVFTQWNGEPMNPHTPTRQFTKFLKRNNIPHRKLHALRHTSATLLLSNGTNIKTVASRLGHMQLSTTNRYVHALRDADEAAAETFKNLLNKEQIKNKNENLS